MGRHQNGNQGVRGMSTRGTPRYAVLDSALMRLERETMPGQFGSWNKAMRAAFVKGATASTMDIPITECPYRDRRKQSGGLTWSRAFRAAWADGWRFAYKLHSGQEWQE